MFSRRTDWNLTPNRLTHAHQQVLGSGRKIIDLTISNPTRAGFEYDQSTILDSLRNQKALEYDPQPKGLLAPRQAIAEYYSSRSGAAVGPDPESLILTTSTSEGYSYVFRLLSNPGDEILVPKPSYPLFGFLADLADVKLVPYLLIYDHGWQIDFDSLVTGSTDRTRAIVLVHPNNPTGSYVSAVEAEFLNALCLERKLALIVDEVFLDYAHDRQSRPSFIANRDTLTFTLSGLSKISALPQMKLAWIRVSGPLNETQAALERLEVIADTYLSLNAPIQFAAPDLLVQRRAIQPQIMRRVHTNLDELDRQLGNQKFCSRLAIQGGWYVILRIPATGSDEDFAVALLEQHSVFVHPGHFYDFPSDGYMVLSLIAPEQEFREGLSALLGLASTDRDRHSV
jgi:alanine-synthesizing transaminase